MARRVYFSFHFARDAQRAAQVRKIGAIEGQPLLSSNRWEEVARGGDRAIRRWIHSEMKGKSCVVVLGGGGDRRSPFLPGQELSLKVVEDVIPDRRVDPASN
jgi:hypothetical protein